MSDNKTPRKSDTSLEAAEGELHKQLTSDHPELLDEKGDCPPCVSLSHEMAGDPSAIPSELEAPAKKDKS